MKSASGQPENLNADGLRIGIVVARFNKQVTQGLLSGALEELKRLGAADQNIEVVWVPGSFEIPLAAQRLAGSGFDAVICLGALIKGETDHYEYLASAVAQSIARIALDHSLPVAFGVLTTRTLEQALSRSRSGPGNKGAEAVAAAVEMAQMERRLESV